MGVLTRAFRDNPLDVAVIGDDPARRERSITHGMRATLRSARGCWTLSVSSPPVGHPSGILLASPPGLFPLDPPSLLVHLRSVLGQGLRVSTRWGVVYRALEDVHPLEPHWYLSLLGVDPSHQGQGLGRALLTHFLGRVDRDRMPSYLETDRPENVAFYARAGFAVRCELRVLGAPVWCMLRPPVGPGQERGAP